LLQLKFPHNDQSRAVDLRVGPIVSKGAILSQVRLSPHGKVRWDRKPDFFAEWNGNDERQQLYLKRLPVLDGKKEVVFLDGNSNLNARFRVGDVGEDGR